MQVRLDVSLMHGKTLRTFSRSEASGEGQWQEQPLQYGSWDPMKDVQDGLGFLVHATVQA
jgi:hypothetical protein